MSFKVRKLEADAIFAAVEALNQRQTDSVAALFHRDRTSVTSGDYTKPVRTSTTVAAANATDSPTLVVLANELKLDYNYHCDDAFAHKVADTANKVTNANATDTATANVLLNEMKADYNTHIASTTFHYNADGTNNVTNANGTDLATGIVLANEMKGDLNAHMNSAPAGAMVELISA